MKLSKTILFYLNFIPYADAYFSTCELMSALNVAWHKGIYMVKWWFMTLEFREHSTITPLSRWLKTSYNTVTSKWARWRLKLPASPLFTQPLIRMQIKENIKVPCHWSFRGEFIGDRWINAENVSIWWRHHEWILHSLGDIIPSCFHHIRIMCMESYHPNRHADLLPDTQRKKIG